MYRLGDDSYDSLILIQTTCKTEELIKEVDRKIDGRMNHAGGRELSWL